jgi:curved DNA-binding protein CbpA
VRAAFRGLAKKWHPDKFRGSKEEGENGSGGGAAAGAAAAAAEAAAKFRGIQQAYEALMEASGVLFGEDGN